MMNRFWQKRLSDLRIRGGARWWSKGLVAGLGCLLGISTGQAQAMLKAELRPNRIIRLLWTDAEGRYSLERSASLQTGSPWTPVADVSVAGSVRSVELTPDSSMSFFRLRDAVPVNPGIESTSPFGGETGVSVSREFIVRFSAPLATNAVIEPDTLFAGAGGRRILSRTELSPDRRILTLFFLENLPAGNRVNVVMDASRLPTEAGPALDADGDGKPGGVRTLSFDTGSTVGLPGTGVIGRVFASEKNPDGSNRPLANAIVTVDGAEETLRTTTDSTGFFQLSPVPAGRFFVHVDGRTATGSQWPDGAYYPFVGKAWEAVARRMTNPAGGSGEIFLPLVPRDALTVLNASIPTAVKLPPSTLATNPALAGVEITVPPNSLFADNGTRGGRVGIAIVAPDRLPEPLPPDLNLPVVITIQTDGPQNFSQPVPVKFPNLPDPATGMKLPPGAKTVLWSFNHDTGRWESQGTATISPDGQFAVTDPGVGVRQPGWHGVAPGTPGSSGPPGGGGPPGSQGGGGPPNPGKCGAEQQLKPFVSVVDLAVDVAIVPLNVAPPLKCATGFAIGNMRSARDCALFDLDDCLPTIRNNLINSALGCIPIYGDLLSITMSSAQTAQELDKYFDNCGAGASAGNPDSRSGNAKPANSIDAGVLQKFDAAKDLLTLQSTVSSALSDLNALILGSRAWSNVALVSADQTYTRLLQSLQAALAETSQQSRDLSPDERAAMLQLPLPEGITSSDLTTLLDRFQDIDPGGLSIPATPANLAVFSKAESVLQQIADLGWQSPNEGAMRALALIQSIFEPLPPGTALGIGLHVDGDDGDDGESLPLNQRVFPRGEHQFALINLTSGFVQRGKTRPSGNLDGLILAPNTHYAIAYLTRSTPGFDVLFPRPPYQGIAVFKSAAAGTPTRIPYAMMLETSGEPPFGDLDGDEMPDLAEMVAGTDLLGGDSDKDGIPDGVELRLGTNPADGLPPVVGNVAGTDTPGTALDVAVLGNHAFVADGERGLAVFELRGFENPVLLSQLQLAGRAADVACEGDRLIVGLGQQFALINVSNRAVPQILMQTNPGADVQAVAMRGNQAFVALQNGTLLVLHSATGTEVQRLTRLDTRLDDLAFAGSRLMVLSGDELICLSRENEVWIPLGRVTADGGLSTSEVGRKLIASFEHAWVGTSRELMVFDIRNPSLLQRISAVQTTGAAIHDMALTGGGRLAAVTSFTGQSAQAVSLYDISKPEIVTNFLTSIQTSGVERALKVDRGMILVASGSAGLQIVSFLPPDFGTNPPSIALSIEYPSSTGKAEFGSTIPIHVAASDDVGVRSLELELDGQIVATTAAMPHTFSPSLPSKSPGRTAATIRVRAVDTAGNVAWSPPQSVPLVDDALPPQIVSADPPFGGTLSENLIADVTIIFNEPVASPITENSLIVRNSGPDTIPGNGDDVPLPGTVSYDGPNRQLTFTASSLLASGSYTVTLDSNIADGLGNVRSRPLQWQLKKETIGFLFSTLPLQPMVRVGEVRDSFVIGFQQPLHSRTLKTLEVSLTRLPFPPEPQREYRVVEVVPDPTKQFVTIRFDAPLSIGLYRLRINGTGIQGLTWDFHYRNVPNEFVVDPATGRANWKYAGGQGVGDELIVNAPGVMASVEARYLKSLVARTDVTLLNNIDVEQGVITYGRVLFGGVVSRVTSDVTAYGPVESSVNMDQGTLNLHGGGGGRLSFAIGPNAVVINHPGSALVFSNAGFGGTVTPTGPLGQMINAGTSRFLGEFSPNRGVNIRNDGEMRFESRATSIDFLDNRGRLEFGPGTKTTFHRRFLSSETASLIADGPVEFTSDRFGSSSAEIRGPARFNGPLSLTSADVTLWQSLVTTTNPVTLGSSVLRLVSAARLGPVDLGSSRLVLPQDSTIDRLISSGGTLEFGGATEVKSYTGRGIQVLGPGQLTFSGSNTIHDAYVRLGHTTIRFTGLWRQIPTNGGQQINFERSQEGVQPGTGRIENHGRFEHLALRPWTLSAPFWNFGELLLGPGPIVVDGISNTFTRRFGAIIPQPGSTLTLSNSTVIHSDAGTYDHVAGILRGTGTFRLEDNVKRPRFINRATLQPGNPTGSLDIRATDAFEQTDTGEMVVSISDTGFGRVTLNCPALIAGRLKVILLNGFSPDIGRVYSFLTYRNRNGEFTGVDLPDLGPTKKFQLEYDPLGFASVRVVAK